MPKVHCYHSNICLCVYVYEERWSSHRCLCCGSLTGSSWYLSCLLSLIVTLSVSVSISRFHQLPANTPVGGGVFFAKAPVGVT